MRASSQAIRPFGLEAPKQRRNKFNVAPVAERTCDGIIFASKAEMRRYSQLKLLERAGHIRQIELQPRFKYEIEGKLMFTYVADYAYFEGLSRIVEDCKGVRTPVYRLKKKIIEQAFKIKIREVS